MPWKPREAHCGHLYPPQTPYWEKISGQVAGGFIIFDGGEVAGLRRLIRPPYGYAKIVDPGGRLEEPLERIAQAGAERGDSGYWEALGWCCRLFSLLGEASLRQEESYDLPTGEQPKTPLLSQKVQSYFRQHMAEPVRLEAVAAHLHLSPSSLSHRYRKETGESVMKTQQRMRIEQAKTLLLRGERLEIIARQTGFHDAFHLSRSFKQITCLSPSAFRLERGS